MPQPQPDWPPLATRLIRLALPAAERDEIIADIDRDYRARWAADPRAARRWLWRQCLQSLPALLRWSFNREASGYESPANAFRPGDPMLNTFLADARYAARRLRTRPAYALLSTLTLALGVGGTAAVFAIAKPMMFEALPYAHADEVTTFWFGGSWNEREYTFFRGKVPGYREVALYVPNQITLRDGDGPLRLLPAIRASSELFDVLGARPVLGRGFRPGDDLPGAEPTVVLSYGLWQELGGDQSVLGRRLTLDGSPRTVVGVMPKGFWFPDPSTRIYVAHAINPNGGNGSYSLLGRVAAGENPANMSAQLGRFTAMLGSQFTYSAKWDKTKNAEVTPIREAIMGPMRPALLATAVAMLLILLIACVNVTALLLGQLEGRTSELAVRNALGATRRRLVQQLLVEATLLGIAASVVGSAFAMVGLRVMAEALPIGAWSANTGVDPWLFFAALGFAILAALLVAIAPVISLSRGDLQSVIGRARTGGIQGRGGRLEKGLVVVEVALAMLVASAAALLVRSVDRLYSIDPGIATENRAVLDFVASAELNPVQRRQQMQALKAEVEGLPGVVSVAGAAKLPLRGNGNNFDIAIEGRPELSGATTYFRHVSLDYFRTMGMRILAGRDFNSGDSFNGEIPIVVNEALAKKYFPGQTAVGKIVSGGYGPGPQRIIGVVSDAAEGKLTDDFEPARYYLAGTAQWFVSQVSIVIQTTPDADAAVVIDAARRAVAKTTPGLALLGVTTMSNVLNQAVGPARQVMVLLSILSSLAVLLGAIGIYGVISHFASRRKRDWAIQIALGRTAREVVRQVVGEGVVLTTAGIIIGAIGIIALGRMLSSFLYKTSSVDLLAFAVASAVVLVIGLVAAFVPAWRAGSVEPARVLREQ
jgi:putative ABC transport system permease protein